jgi:ammonium transporter Rh
LVLFYPARDSITNGGLGRTAVEQGGYQIACLATTLGIAIFGGAVTGLLLKTRLFEQINDEHDLFADEKNWIVPDDHLFIKNILE